MQQINAPSMPQMNNNVGPRIKQEPGLDNSQIGGMSQPPFQPPIISGTPAQQRAAAHLQANYGQRAAASISAIQNNAPHQASPPTQQQHTAAIQLQQMEARYQQQQRVQQPKLSMTQEQYRHAMAMSAQQHLQGQNGVNGAQTDGAGDEDESPIAVLKKISAGGEQEIGRIEVDGMIRARILAMGQAMEGGGLMLPLREVSNAKKRQRKIKKSASGPVPQTDGPGSDDDDNKNNVKNEEFDEDAINSDLDDPDDGLNDEEDDDEGMGHIMLCMYDKVQRVKNKW
jgi:transcription initiation factor TFIIA large subunit